MSNGEKAVEGTIVPSAPEIDANPIEFPVVRFQGQQRSITIPPCLLSLEDLKSLETALRSAALVSLEKHLDTLSPGPDLEQLKAEARRTRGLTTIVNGTDGRVLAAATTTNTFVEENMPDRVQAVIFDSSFAMQSQHQVALANRFRILIDFSEPPSFADYDPWNSPTPNSSEIAIEGDDQNWINGVAETAKQFFEHRRKKRAWLHSRTVFATVQWLIGIPVSLAFAYATDRFFQSIDPELAAGIRAGIGLYAFLLCMVFFRFVFVGLRWLFPVVELKGTREHRTLIVSLMISVALGLIFLLAKMMVDGKI